ncbi:MAG: MFS transporter [Nanoarchaeota archaeon]
MTWTRNQKTILRNASLWATYDGLTSTFIVAFALALGASNIWIGIFGALPFVAMLLSQIPGAYSVEFVSRKVIYVVSTGCSRLFWILILVVPYWFMDKPLMYLALFYFVCKLLETFADPSWTTLLADIVPLKIRGIFVGHRNVLISISGVVAYIIGGFVLDWFPKTSFAGFGLLFFVGAFIGLAASLSMRRLIEPKVHQHQHVVLKEFFSLKGDFARFCRFAFVFHFGWMIVSPFFAVYMLKNLGISYTMFVLMMGISSFSKIIAHRHLGRLADRFGDKVIMVFVCVATALVPLAFYAMTPQRLWLLIPVHVFSGIAWAGFDIAMFNMMLDFSIAKRHVQVAEFQMVAALAIIISPIIGGWIADSVSWLITGIPLLFVIGAVIRLASLFFLWKLPESRVLRKFSSIDLFREAITFHPIEGTIHITRNVIRRVRSLDVFGTTRK